MEQLEKELGTLIKKLKDANNFKNELENLKSIEPFNKYEFIISKLFSENLITFDEYVEMRDSYRFRNIFLDVFNLGPRAFGDTWGFRQLISVEPLLKKPSKKYDSNYKGQYDLILEHKGKVIRIELKVSRAVDRNKPNEAMYEKALDSSSKKSFLMNFQQLKPSCCDVYIWMAVYRDKVRYWVMKNDVIKNHPGFVPQHRNEETEIRAENYDHTQIFEGQIMITNENIDSISQYEVESCGLRKAIIEQFENKF